jgi:membrane protease YdiL (CAAX protease family)
MESVPEFSAYEEAFQLLAFYFPAAALVLHFCIKDTSDLPVKQKYTTISKLLPRFALAVLLCTAALLMIGGFTVFCESLLPGAEPFASDIKYVASPSGPVEVSLMAASCLVAAYLEEGFFRVFLYGRLLASGLKKMSAILISSLLFSICHSWEGLWGIAGAFLSGLFLSFLFERKKSLHLIALSHALYNITVYLLPS